MIDNLIKQYEEEVNAIIDTNYNYFYIQPYRVSVPGEYGVIFNGQQIALCKDLSELTNIKFENLKNVVDEKLKEEQEYFSLLRKIEELRPYGDKVTAGMMSMKIKDQIKMLKLALMMNEISKKLCEKYGWDEEIDVVEMD